MAERKKEKGEKEGDLAVGDVGIDAGPDGEHSQHRLLPPRGTELTDGRVRREKRGTLPGCARCGRSRPPG